MIRNAIGQQRLKRQRQLHLAQRILAVLCLLLGMAAVYFLPGWWKLISILVIPVALVLELHGMKAYDQILYAEREKELLALALQRELPQCRVAINYPVGDSMADLLVVGPPGILVILIPRLSYDSIDETVDRQALALQAATQRICAGYPVEALIYAQQMAMLKPSVIRVLAAHSPSGVVDCINRSRTRCTPDEMARICEVLGL